MQGPYTVRCVRAGYSGRSILAEAIVNQNGPLHVPADARRHRTARVSTPARRVLRVLAVIAVASFLASCSSSKPSANEGKLPPGSVSLTGAGSTFSSVLFDRWFTVYHDSHPNTFIKYASVGSGEGVRRFIGKKIADEERVDFGASDSAMSDAEIAETNNDTLMVPVTAG